MSATVNRMPRDCLVGVTAVSAGPLYWHWAGCGSDFLRVLIPVAGHQVPALLRDAGMLRRGR